MYLRKHSRGKEAVLRRFHPKGPFASEIWRAFVKDPVHTAGFFLITGEEGAVFLAGFAMQSLHWGPERSQRRMGKYTAHRARQVGAS